ncbi:MAG: chorismate synthase, partial [Sphingomonas sp.]
MSVNSFGRMFRFTTWGESHGPALGAVVDGCPPGIPLTEADIQPWLDKRRPGTSRFTTQRREPDAVRILSGVFDGRTTGTPISLMIENVDQRSKDYSDVAKAYRPGHADYAYDAKYGFRDYRGGGRSSARETAARVAAGAVARLVVPQVRVRAWVEAIGGDAIDPANFDDAQIDQNPFFCPDATAALRWEALVDAARKAGSSLGAVIACEATGVPAGWGAPLYAKLDADLDP